MEIDNVLAKAMSILPYLLADLIIIESPEPHSCVNIMRGNILPTALRFIDIDKFKIVTPPCKRSYDIGFVGRLENEKGIIEFLKTILILRRKNIKVNALVAGDGSLRNIVVRASKVLGLTYLGYVPHKDLPPLFNSIKAIIIPSKREGVPTVLLEAMSCGVIPIVSTVGGMPWVTKKAGAGILLRTTDPQHIAEAVRWIVELDCDMLESMAKMCREFVENYCSLERAVMRYKIMHYYLNRQQRKGYS